MTVLIGEASADRGLGRAVQIEVAMTATWVSASVMYLHPALAHRSLHMRPRADVGFHITRGG